MFLTKVIAMALRPGRAVRRIKRPWTRISITKPKKSYVVGVPYPKIHIFEMGSRTKEFDTTIYLTINGHFQLRENALESARIVANKYLEKSIGIDNYFMKLLVYPHQVLREHTLATGAGADRFSMGMRKAFGKPKGRAVITKDGMNLFVLKLNKNNIEHGKNALRRAITKLPSTSKILIE